MTSARRLVLAIAVAGGGAAACSSPPKPCPRSEVMADVRRFAAVFEGIVVDQWDETLIDGDGWRTLCHYRFQMLRNWTKGALGDERHLTQGLYTGQAPMRGTYRVFERGHRYLVFAVAHDSPPHAFTTSCQPGADGHDIADLAARLGAPEGTFEAALPAEPPLWQPLDRATEDALGIVRQLIHHAASVAIAVMR